MPKNIKEDIKIIELQNDKFLIINNIFAYLYNNKTKEFRDVNKIVKNRYNLQSNCYLQVDEKLLQNIYKEYIINCDYATGEILPTLEKLDISKYNIIKEILKISDIKSKADNNFIYWYSLTDIHQYLTKLPYIPLSHFNIINATNENIEGALIFVDINNDKLIFPKYENIINMFKNKLAFNSSNFIKNREYLKHYKLDETQENNYKEKLGNIKKLLEYFEKQLTEAKLSQDEKALRYSQLFRFKLLHSSLNCNTHKFSRLLQAYLSYKNTTNIDIDAIKTKINTNYNISLNSLDQIYYLDYKIKYIQNIRDVLPDPDISIQKISNDTGIAFADYFSNYGIEPVLIRNKYNKLSLKENIYMPLANEADRIHAKYDVFLDSKVLSIIGALIKDEEIYIEKQLTGEKRKPGFEYKKINQTVSLIIDRKSNYRGPFLNLYHWKESSVFNPYIHSNLYYDNIINIDGLEL